MVPKRVKKRKMNANAYFPELISKESLADFIGIGINEYIYLDGFPVLKIVGKHDVYPKRAVQKWIDNRVEGY